MVAAKQGVDLPGREARQRAESEQAAKRPQTVEALLRRYVESYCKLKIETRYQILILVVSPVETVTPISRHKSSFTVL